MEQFKTQKATKHRLLILYLSALGCFHLRMYPIGLRIFGRVRHSQERISQCNKCAPHWTIYFDGLFISQKFGMEWFSIFL